LLVASSAAVLTGCSVADEMMDSVGPPTSQTTQAPAPPGAESNAMVVTEQQRAYLDALDAAGVKPSSELMALRIGSYVCQARAVKQSDQAVWDVVVPLVRGDVRTSRLSSTAPSSDEVNSATADYIRIATAKLCEQE
jgi:hypothetical protein